jgi:hypothetical protein
MHRHRVLDLMTHVDPHHRPDLDHYSVETGAQPQNAVQR